MTLLTAKKQRRMGDNTNKSQNSEPEMYRWGLGAGDYITICKENEQIDPWEEYILKEDYVMAYCDTGRIRDTEIKNIYNNICEHRMMALHCLTNYVRMKRGMSNIECILVGPLEWDDKELLENLYFGILRQPEVWLRNHRKSY